MSATRVFVARLAGCGVFDPLGDRVGKVIDVLMAYRKTLPPRATGFIIEISGRRRVFLPISRVTAIAPGQLMTNGLIDLRRFTMRGQEVRAIAEMLGRKVTLLEDKQLASIEDFAIELGSRGDWVLSELFVRKQKKTSGIPFAKGPTVFLQWHEVAENQENPADQDAQQLLTAVS
ncbi:magnesium transporter, partial [Aquiluna sp.]|nr:magnesium transporter [Aquiluna sp.]